MNTNKTENRLTDKQKKIISLCALAALVIFAAVIAWFIGRPMIKLASAPEEFRAWVDSKGVWGWLIFIGMTVFQVVIAFVPGEPLEIGAGYAFGAVWGTVLSVVGTTIGSILVFVLVRKFGVRLVEVFFDVGKINRLKFLQNEKKRDLLLFTVFLLPGTPKDLLTFFVGLTDIPFGKFFVIASVTRLPSIITSTVGGSALGVKEYELAVIVFAATVVVSLLGLFIYNRICKHRQKQEKNV